MMARSIFAAFLSIFGIGNAPAPAVAAPKADVVEPKPAGDQSMDYLTEIARVIFDNEDIDSDWDELSLVMSFDADSELNETYGYAYDVSGDYEAFSIRPRLMREPAEAYRSWLKSLPSGKTAGGAPVNNGIIKMLFQFNRRNSKVNADFEYDDPTRWKVTPDNLEAMIETLRPKL